MKATVVPRQAGVRVYFASYDVDDPTANTTQVDADDPVQPDGDDNRGMPKAGAFVNNVQFADTDANGEARVQFVTKVQPGDNFRVAASLQEDAFASLTVIAQETTLGKKLVPANSEPTLDGFAGRLSPLLTGWRTLHIKVRTMAAPGNANYVTGNIIQIDHRLFLDKNLRIDLADPSANLEAQAILPDRGRFENGVIEIGDGSVRDGVYGNGDDYVRKELGDIYQNGVSI